MKTHHDPVSGCRFPAQSSPSSFSDTYLEPAPRDDGTCPECTSEVQCTRLPHGAYHVECLVCDWEMEGDGL